MSIAHDDLINRLRFGLPDRLGKALSVAGVPSNDMADYLGISRTTISNYINGRTEPKKQTLRLWAVRTGVPLEWLETGHLDGEDGGPNMQTPD
jgi:transcriptional regulator with XRE-family HTH domain